MSNTPTALLFRLIMISALLLISVGCSDHKKENAAAFKEGVAAFNKGDFGVALEKFKAAADQGNADAQYNLGVMYRQGKGVPADDQKAIELWTKAADQGNNVTAQFSLGLLYRQGKGVPADDRKAVAYWSKAAEQGHNMAQMYLGIMYAQGSGVTADKVQAYKWFSIAANKDNRAAAQNLSTVSARMEPTQIEQGKALAQKWLADHPQK